MSNQQKYQQMLIDFANQRNKEAAKLARELELDSSGLSAEDIEDLVHVLKRTKDCVID